MIEQADDFRDESDALHRLLAPLPEADFERPSRFKQWTINEVIAHLHVWNWAAQCALMNPPAFADYLSQVQARRKTVPLRLIEHERTGGLKGQALLAAWQAQYRSTAQSFRQADPRERVKWSGPDMSARSSITARLMETWAHGQAVYDLLGEERADGERIRNIAVLGINTYGWTFKTHQRPLPGPIPHVVLRAPSGEIWRFNEPSATEVIEGSATEFCQVVTQVRNIADTRLVVRGAAATEWMSIAQCFAGPPEQPPAPATRFRETRAA